MLLGKGDGRLTMIVRRGRLYLVGRSAMTGDLIWSAYKYDAWRTECRKDAEKVAGRIGGEVLTFDRLTGQTGALEKVVV